MCAFVGLLHINVEFVSDRISYIVLRDRRCNIFVLNAHAPSEEKSADSKDSCMRKCSSLR